MGLRSESLRSARKGGFRLEEAAEGGGGDRGGEEQDILPSPEAGQVVGEGQKWFFQDGGNESIARGESWDGWNSPNSNPLLLFPPWTWWERKKYHF